MSLSPWLSLVKMIKKNATIKDVAIEANVTNVTVSRAFTTPDKVKKQTRELIYKIAEEMNYIPNVYARNLKNKTSNVIGFVTDNVFNPVYSTIIHEACTDLESKGYSVMIFSTHGSPTTEAQAINTLISYKASGIFLSVINDSENESPPYLDKILNSDTTLVLMDRDIASKNLSGVFIDNIDSGEKVGKILSYSLGKKVLVISGGSSSMISQQRIAGIQSTAPTDISLSYLYADYEYEKAKSITLNYLADHGEQFDCIVGLNGIITLAAIRAINKLNLKNINFVSIDAVPNADDFGIKIPCVAHDGHQWSRELTNLLLSKLENKPCPERILLKGQLCNVPLDMPK